MTFKEWFFKKRNNINSTIGVYEKYPNSIFDFGSKCWKAAQTEWAGINDELLQNWIE